MDKMACDGKLSYHFKSLCREMAKELITLPTNQLLKKFGSGAHKPGSGSAAALLGLVSCKLIQTVVSLSNGRAEYRGVEAQLTLANQNILEDIEPILLAAVQDDAEQFDRVIKARRIRDSEKDPEKKKPLNVKALQELRAATEIPMRILETCLNLAEKGITVFDLGFKSARGDSGVAISSAIAGAFGCLSIIYLNLTSFRGGEWAAQMRHRANQYSRRAQELQLELLSRVSRLQQEVEDRESQSTKQ